MTVVTDSKKRVTLRYARPGDRFDVKFLADGKFVLTRLEPVPEPQPVKPRFIKERGYTVGVGPQPITQEQVRALLDEFP
jgi:hypothetical protein